METKNETRTFMDRPPNSPLYSHAVVKHILRNVKKWGECSFYWTTMQAFAVEPPVQFFVNVPHPDRPKMWQQRLESQFLKL